MDSVHRALLLRHREDIVADMQQPTKLIPKLVANKILNHEHLHLIHAQQTPQAQMRQILDLLPYQGASAFSVFCDALSVDYSWLSDTLRKDAEEVVSLSQGDQTDLKEELFLDARLRGGVPLPPPNFVFRGSQVEDVRKKLHSLSRQECLVLHGMTGSGKSCLAAAALDSKDLVLGTFKGMVVWLSLGDGLLPAQLALLNKLDCHWPSPAHHNSSPHYPPPSTIDTARDVLIERITRSSPPGLRDMLLVLDDVSSPDTARAFSIGVRMLLLTHDQGFLGALLSQCTIMTMAPGFTEEESLRLLASSVDLDCVTVSVMFPEAHEIHRKAWGFPLVISLIGGMLAEYKEDACRNRTRWQQYSDMLSRQHRVRRNSLSHPGLMEAITQSLNVLAPELQERYRMLVVFDSDVNILPEVLSILWNLSKYEVEEIMCEFLRKCLASRRWNEELKCYVYGIHYLLLHYLYVVMTENEVKNCHVELVLRYQTAVDSNWGLLPKDNYAHLFLAQHMVKAQLGRDLLPKMLLNIDFLAARLSVSVPSDILRDFQRLKEEADAEMMPVIDDFEFFMKQWGEAVRRRPFLNLIQCALQWPYNNPVHQSALHHLARLENLDSYMLTRKVMFSVGESNNIRAVGTQSSGQWRSFEVCGQFATARIFCDNILLARADGSIVLWDVLYNRPLYDFPGLLQPATALVVAQDHQSFAAASKVGEVLLWDTPPNLCLCDGRDAPTPPPRVRQASWQPVHGNNSGPDYIRLETGVKNAASSSLDISTSGTMLAWSCSEKIIVWSYSRGSATELWSIDKVENATSVVFGMADTVLFIAAGDIFICSSETGSILQTIPAGNPDFILPFRGNVKTNGWCLELSSQQLKEWEWWGRLDGHNSSFSPVQRPLKSNDQMLPLCISAALSVDQKILGVMTPNYELLVLDRSDMANLFTLPASTPRLLLDLKLLPAPCIRALLGGDNGSVTTVDINLESEKVLSNGIPSPLVWSNDHNWLVHLIPSSDLRIRSDGYVSVVPNATALSCDGSVLSVGFKNGDIWTMWPMDLSQAPVEVGKLSGPVSHLSCTKGHVAAVASRSHKVKVFGPEGEIICMGLEAAPLAIHLLGNKAGDLHLLACTSEAIKTWDVKWHGSEDTIRYPSTNPVTKSHKVVAVDFHQKSGTLAMLCTRENEEPKYYVVVKQVDIKFSRRIFELCNCWDLDQECSALIISPCGQFLWIAMPNQCLLTMWDISNASLEATIIHPAAESVWQIGFNGSHIVTGGQVLAWWSCEETEDGRDLKFVHALQLEAQCGSLCFASSEDDNKSELLVSDEQGSLYLVQQMASPGRGENSQDLLDPPCTSFILQPLREQVLQLVKQNGHNREKLRVRI